MDGLNDFHEYSTSSPKFYKYLEYEPFGSLNDSRDYLNRLLTLEKNIESRSCISWFIRLKSNDKVVGTARLVNIDYHRSSVSWGYGISPALWGQGFVFEIQRILAEYIFETMSFNRLSGVARIDNLPTISTLKAFGFKEEGVEREAMRDFNGVYYDTWLYSMLNREYALSKNIETIQVERYKDKFFSSSAKVDLIIKELTQENFTVNDTLLLKDIPGWDSLMQMQLISTLEKSYGLQLTMEDILFMSNIKSVKSIVVKLTNNPKLC
jgi:RimJ/RimL family protein N-acetyltransferase/acyl carrier protein